MSPLGWLEINTDRRDSNIPLALIACEEGTRTILKKIRLCRVVRRVNEQSIATITYDPKTR